MNRPIHIIGVPIDLGTQRSGVDMRLNALRYAGLISALQQTGLAIKDLGNLQVLTPESRLFGLKNLNYSGHRTPHGNTSYFLWQVSRYHL